MHLSKDVKIVPTLISEYRAKSIFSLVEERNTIRLFGLVEFLAHVALISLRDLPATEKNKSTNGEAIELSPGEAVELLLVWVDHHYKRMTTADGGDGGINDKLLFGIKLKEKYKQYLNILLRNLRDDTSICGDEDSRVIQWNQGMNEVSKQQENQAVHR